MDAVAVEAVFGDLDLGPVDSMSPEERKAAQQAFNRFNRPRHDAAQPDPRPGAFSAPDSSSQTVAPPDPQSGSTLASNPPSHGFAPPHSRPGSTTATKQPLPRPHLLQTTTTRISTPSPYTPASSSSKTPSSTPVDNARRLSGNSADRKRKKQSKSRKREKRQLTDADKPRYGEDEAVQRGHTAGAPATQSKYELGTQLFTKPGFTALPEQGARGVYSADYLINNLGFKYVEANEGNRPRAITDAAGRVVAVQAGAPRDPGWAAVCKEAYEALQAASARCRFTHDDVNHRRGRFPVLNAGISHGNGTTEPGNLTQTCAANTAAAEDLINHPSFRRIAGFASSAVQAWFPKLFTYLKQKRDAVIAWNPDLRQLFKNSIFAAVAFNLGPRTVSSKHRDIGNIPFSICTVTALGRFDHRKGAHMVLWEPRLVIEFPASTTMILPSAVVSHSNTPLHSPEEVRGSFAQFTAGGLLRWVEHGFQIERLFKKGKNKEAMKQVDLENEERSKHGISLFSTLAELRAKVVKKVIPKPQLPTSS